MFFVVVWPSPPMVFPIVFDLATIAFNGFKWFVTVGQTKRWFQWMVVVYCQSYLFSKWMDFYGISSMGLSNTLWRSLLLFVPSPRHTRISMTNMVQWVHGKILLHTLWLGSDLDKTYMQKAMWWLCDIKTAQCHIAGPQCIGYREKL